MAIPDYQTIMLPFLQFLADGKEHGIREVVDKLCDPFKLSSEDQSC